MDEELLAEFLTESNENLASIEEQLLDLEADPGNADTVDSIFRVIHTVKGSCGFLGLKGLEKVAHAGENLLGKVRSTKFKADGDIISLLLESTDMIKELIAGIEESGSEPVIDSADLCIRLAAAERLIEGGGASVASEITDVVSMDWLEGIEEQDIEILQQAGLCTQALVLAAGFEKLRAIEGIKPAVALKVLGIAKASSMASTKAVPIEQPLPAEVQTQAVVVADAVEEQKEPEQKESLPVVAAVNTQVQPTRKPKAEGSIRVDVALLDELMNQVGELVLSRNRLLRLVEQSTDTELVRTSRGVSQITSRLQEKLLHTRMQPISTLWSTVPRLLRDITKNLGKKIRVEMEGQETELDRTILAALKDPMTHIIRNSCDHGIESPEVRRAKGKPEEGKISLEARQESGFIVIDINDNGGGIDPKKIRDKALKMGVITAEQATTMSDKAALQLIFHAGLSTVEKISNLSGRGVGMDVVRSEIEGVGGTVEIDSELGAGTTLHIRIPLTLAIIPAMIVASSGQHFAIPQMVVQELISISRNNGDWEDIAGKPFYRLRGRLLPIIGLSEVLKQEASQKEMSSFVVINIADRQFGIGVDHILGAEEIVVKPLGCHFNNLDVYGGCSILGDGMVVPILDCMGITKDLRQGQEVASVVAEHEADRLSIAEESQYILVFAVGEQWYAIPMALVERIEEIDTQAIEKSGRREVVQYRGDVVQVVRLSEVLEIVAAEKGDSEPCLIIADQGRRLCIQVDRIIDIVKQKLEIHLESSEPYFLGTAVIEDRSTEVIDIFEVIKKSAPNWFAKKGGDRRSRVQRIVYVEDALFFRNLVLPVLEGLGCEILMARDGIEAQEILKHQQPDLILTDIEMPRLDGFALATWIREQPNLEKTPIISLSSLDPSEFAGQAHLFNACVKKFDREILIEHLTQLLGRKRPEKQNSLTSASVIDGQLVD